MTGTCVSAQVWAVGPHRNSIISRFKRRSVQITFNQPWENRMHSHGPVLVSCPLTSDWRNTLSVDAINNARVREAAVRLASLI